MSIIQSFLKIDPSLIVTKPKCPFCRDAKKMLDDNKVSYRELDCEKERELVEAIKQEKKHNTFPMIFVNSEFVGGFQQLEERYGKKKDTQGSTGL